MCGYEGAGTLFILLFVQCQGWNVCKGTRVKKINQAAFYRASAKVKTAPYLSHTSVLFYRSKWNFVDYTQLHWL